MISFNLFSRNQRDRTGYHEEELYYAALSSPFEFFDRFKFEVPDYEHRRQILNLKDKHKLEDESIYLLKKTGDLKLGKDNKYGIVAERWAWWAGCLQTLIGLLIISYMLLLILPHNLNLQELMQCLAVILIPTLLLWLNYRLLMKPWLILTRLGCKPNLWYGSD